MADKSNHVAYIDLQDCVHNLRFFHVIDSTATYSVSYLIFTKHQDEIMSNSYPV